MRVAAIAFLVLLSACASFPRGAALQREVLETGTETTLPADGTAHSGQEFAVAPVTRSLLASYAAWPGAGDGTQRGWIGKVEQGHGRIISVGDTILVNIWTAEDNGLLTMPGQRQASLPPVRVMADGSVFLPYIGNLRLQGMSERRAREVVEKAYEAVSPAVQVQLALEIGRQGSISLVGGVAKPGVYPMEDRNVSVMELIAMGGGVAPGIRNPQIRLQRGGSLYGVSVARLMNTPSLNTTLQGGDQVFVEEDRRYFLSLGAAGREAQVHFPQDRVTALDALSLIGGLAPARADVRGILILRRYPASALRRDGNGPGNSRTIFTLDLTSADGLFSAGEFQIQPGDLVYVTESPLGPTRTVLGLIGSVFGIANTASAIGG